MDPKGPTLRGNSHISTSVWWTILLPSAAKPEETKQGLVAICYSDFPSRQFSLSHSVKNIDICHILKLF